MYSVAVGLCTRESTNNERKKQHPPQRQSLNPGTTVKLPSDTTNGQLGIFGTRQIKILGYFIKMHSRLCKCTTTEIEADHRRAQCIEP